MSVPIPPMCISCSRLDTKSPMEWPRLRCDAYPGGVPLAIVERRADHTKPYAGDGGKQFEQDKDRPEPIPL